MLADVIVPENSSPSADAMLTTILSVPLTTFSLSRIHIYGGEISRDGIAFHVDISVSDDESTVVAFGTSCDISIGRHFSTILSLKYRLQILIKDMSLFLRLTTLIHCSLLTPYGDIELCQRRLMAPSHYLSQYWLIIGVVPWYSSEGIITIWTEDTNQVETVD